MENKRPVPTSKETYCSSIKKTTQLIVSRKTVHINNRNYTKLTNQIKDTNTLCEQNVEFLNVEISGTQITVGL